MGPENWSGLGHMPSKNSDFNLDPNGILTLK